MQTMLRSKITLLFMMLGLLLAIPAVAIAADINKTVDVDAKTADWQDTGIYFVQATTSSSLEAAQ